VDWVTANYPNEGFEVHENTPTTGSLPVMYEVDLDNGLFAIFDNTHTLINASGGSYNPPQEDDHFKFENLPQTVKDWLNQSSFANDLEGAVITELPNDASTNGGEVIFDIELVDERVILITETGQHLINLPSIEVSSNVDETNAPQSIKDWVDQNTVDEEVHVLLLEGEIGGNTASIYEMEIDDGRYVLFNSQGTFLNASWDPWGDETDEPNDFIAFEDLPEAVQDWLEQSPYHQEINQLAYSILPNDASTNGEGNNLIEVFLQDGRVLILTDAGKHLITLPEFREEEHLPDSDIPQQIRDWLNLNAAGIAADLIKAKGEKDGTPASYYELGLDDDRIAIFDAAGGLINFRFEDYDAYDDEEPVEPGISISFGDLPIPVKEWLEQSDYANKLSQSEFRHIFNDASPDGAGTDVYEVRLPDDIIVILNPAGHRVFTTHDDEEREDLAVTDLPVAITDWLDEHILPEPDKIHKIMDKEPNSTGYLIGLQFDDGRRAFFDKEGVFLHAHYDYEDIWQPVELPQIAEEYLDDHYAEDDEELVYWVEERTKQDGSIEYVVFLDDLEISFDKDGNFLEERDPWKEIHDNLTPGLQFLAESSTWSNDANTSQGSFTIDTSSNVISTIGGAAPAFAKLVFVKREGPEHDENTDSTDHEPDEWDPHTGSLSYTFGFASKETPGDTSAADYDLSATDLVPGTIMTLNFSYEFGPIRYILINGAELESFKHKMPDYDGPGEFSMTVSIADPAASASDPDGSLLGSAFGFHIEMGGEFHYEGSVFVSDVFWQDIYLAKHTQPWDPVLAFNVDGQAGQSASFAAYLPKWVIEERFWVNKPSEVRAAILKEDGSLNFITGSTVEGDSFVGGDFQRLQFKGREFPLDDAGNVDQGQDSGNVPESIIDFNGDGFADPSLMVSFTNDSWSSADVQIGAPFVDPWSNVDTSTFGSISGMVTDNAGNPLEHFDVWIMDASNGPDKIYDGEPVFYEFERGEHGQYTVKAGPGIYYLEANAHDPATGQHFRPHIHGDANGPIIIEILNETTQIAGVDFSLQPEFQDTGERGKVTGSILDEQTGEYVYQANIEVFPIDEGDETTTDYPLGHGWMENDGKFYVESPLGRVLLKIFTWDNSYAPEEFIIDVAPNQETDAGEIRLIGRKLGTVSGTITNSLGHPIHADVLFLDAEDEEQIFWPKEFQWEFGNDGQLTGNFTAAIPDGDYKILVEYWDRTLMPAFYQNGTTGIDEFDDASIITVSETAPVQGVVVQLQPVPMGMITLSVFADQDSTLPIEGAFLAIHDAEEEYGEIHFPHLEASDPFDGSYSAKLPEGEYKLEIIAPGYASRFLLFDESDEPLWIEPTWDEGDAIDIEAEQNYDLGIAVLEKLDNTGANAPEWLDFGDHQDITTVSGIIEGSVKTQNGQMVPKAHIIAHTEDHILWFDNNHTNSAGIFKIENLPVGDWVVYALPPLESDAYRNFRESDPVEVKVVAGQTHSNIDLTLNASNVSGRILLPVKDANGVSKLEPLGNVFVWAYLDADNDGWPDVPDEDDNTAADSFEIIEQFGETDESGFFSFHFEEAGSYKLQVDVPHAFNNSKPAPISFNIQNPNKLTRVGNAISVTWRPTTAAEGFTIDRRSGTNSQFSTITTSPLSAQTRSYIDTTIKAGNEYSYRVNSIRATGTITLGADAFEVSNPFVYLAPPSKVIEGSVLDTTGNAVSGAQVVAFSNHGYAETITRNDGSYQMNAGPGKWEVTIERPWDSKVDWRYTGYPKKARFLEDSSSETKTLNFEVQRAGGGKVIGVLKKPDGTSDWVNSEGFIFVDAYNEEGDGGSTQIEDDGSFEIPLLPGVYEVSIWVDFSLGSYTPPEPITVKVQDAEVNLGDLMLEELNSFIEGTITSGEGTPLPNFFVSAWDRNGNFAWDITNANGEYELAVKPGRWEVMYDLPIPESDDQVIPYLPQQPKKVKVNDGETRSVDFTVVKADNFITGSVVDATGNPVSDLDLWVYIRNGDANATRHDFVTEAEVDGRGKFEVSLADGSYIAGLWLPGNSGYRLNQEVAFQVSGGTVTFDGNQTSLVLQLLANDAVISGSFKIGGTTVSGIEGDVFAFQGNHGWVETSIEEDGTYSLVVGPGDWFVDYFIYYDADDSRTIRPHPEKATKVTAISGNTVTQDFTLQTANATITGTINDENGNQLSSQTVYVWAHREGTDTVEEYWSEAESSNGTFSLNVLSDGIYKVGAFLSPELRDAGYLPPNKVEVDLSNTNSGIAVLALNKKSESNYISGTVEIDGNPIENAYVYGWSDAGNSADSETDEQGNFKLLVPKGAQWKVGADYFQIDENGNETIYIIDEELEVDFSNGEFVDIGTIALIEVQFELPDGNANTFDPTKDFTTILPDGTEIFIAANSVPVDDTVEEVRLVVDPIANGLVKDGNEQPVEYGYSIELFDDQGRVINQNFLKPVQITMEFDPDGLEAMGIDPEELQISFFNPTKNTWTNADSVVVDVPAGKISATATHFSSWAPTSPPPDSTDVEQSVSLLDGIFANATELGAGWYASDWFGVFYHDADTENNAWAFHGHLGWVYLYGTDSSDIWIYSDNENLGWVWTNSTLFTTNSLDRPEATLYRNSDSRWIYYKTLEDETESRFGANAFYLYMTGSETSDPGWIVEE
jgi:protocatechuate 3,4-dioxygenase beta subunit